MKSIILFALLFGLLQSPCLAMEDKDKTNLDKDEWPHLSKTLQELNLKDQCEELARRCEALANQMQCQRTLSPEQLIEFKIRNSILENQLYVIKNQSNIISLQVELLEEYIRKIEKKE
jgi:hypothetical protein